MRMCQTPKQDPLRVCLYVHAHVCVCLRLVRSHKKDRRLFISSAALARAQCTIALSFVCCYGVLTGISAVCAHEALPVEIPDLPPPPSLSTPTQTMLHLCSCWQGDAALLC